MNAPEFGDLSNEQRMLVDSVRSYAREMVAPRFPELDLQKPHLPEELMSAASEIGLLGALVPEVAGGSGLEPFDFCLALVEVAAESAGIAAALLSHNVALFSLSGAGLSDEVADLLEGSAITSCLLEGNVRMLDGSKDGIEGCSPFAINAPVAGALVGTATDGTGVSVFKTDRDKEGVEVEGMPAQMGFRPAPIGTVAFNRAGIKVLPGTDDLAGRAPSLLRLGMASIATGLMRKAYAEALTYARERYQGKDMIINHEQVRLMLASMLVRIEAGDALLRAASGEKTGIPGATACLSAKISITSSAARTTEDAVQIMGGYGYMREQGMERLMRDAAYTREYPESNVEARAILMENAL